MRSISNEKNLCNKKIVLTNVSRITPYKGHKYLIKIFKELVLLEPKFELLIVGDFSQENEKYFKELKVLVSNYKLENKIQFLGFKMRKTLTISIIIAGCVFISNIIFNRETLFGNIEHMTNINSNDIEDNRESVFSSVPAAYKLMENDENIFNFADKYSFSLFERSRPMTKVEKSMIETEEMKFNEPRNEPLKLHVVFKKDYEEPAGEEGEEAVEEAFDESNN